MEAWLYWALVQSSPWILCCFLVSSAGRLSDTSNAVSDLKRDWKENGIDRKYWDEEEILCFCIFWKLLQRNLWQHFKLEEQRIKIYTSLEKFISRNRWKFGKWYHERHKIYRLSKKCQLQGACFHFIPALPFDQVTVGK